jgi:hypothetical protein
VTFQNIYFLLHINSRKLHGQYRSEIEYLNECYNVFKIDRSIKSDYKISLIITNLLKKLVYDFF